MKSTNVMKALLSLCLALLEEREPKVVKALAKPSKAKKPKAAPTSSDLRPLTAMDVARLRSKLKMNGSELARRLGVTPPTIFYWENRPKPFVPRNEGLHRKILGLLNT